MNYERTISGFVSTVFVSSAMVLASQPEPVDLTRFSDPMIGQVMYISLIVLLFVYGFVYASVAVGETK